MIKKILCAVALGALASTSAFAWPTKPITLVVPFPPGGSTDMIARTLSSKLPDKPLFTVHRFHPPSLWKKFNL